MTSPLSPLLSNMNSVKSLWTGLSLALQPLLPLLLFLKRPGLSSLATFQSLTSSGKYLASLPRASPSIIAVNPGIIMALPSSVLPYSSFLVNLLAIGRGRAARGQILKVRDCTFRPATWRPRVGSLRHQICDLGQQLGEAGGLL